ncbi:hypothetical protein, variant 1 [Fonticula alba]|uniref:VLRF1 domain-containing protein n=2 Tax=Fonticula alba TaxID=691883 RepID=A0A058Z3G3_FONAL|nr:hypothetical protein, variant 1 [Fonticula alba]KCV68805.1 hypothetical protein, variant 1 [Fonticula alba]|eukprot:XP_009496376.1 hypothetical protein, variant 1 [Fonticula alba]
MAPPLEQPPRTTFRMSIFEMVKPPKRSPRMHDHDRLAVVSALTHRDAASLVTIHEYDQRIELGHLPARLAADQVPTPASSATRAPPVAAPPAAISPAAAPRHPEMAALSCLLCGVEEFSSVAEQRMHFSRDPVHLANMQRKRHGLAPVLVGNPDDTQPRGSLSGDDGLSDGPASDHLMTGSSSSADENSDGSDASLDHDDEEDDDEEAEEDEEDHAAGDDEHFGRTSLQASNLPVPTADGDPGDNHYWFRGLLRSPKITLAVRPPDGTPGDRHYITLYRFLVEPRFSPKSRSYADLLAHAEAHGLPGAVQYFEMQLVRAFLAATRDPQTHRFAVMMMQSGRYASAAFNGPAVSRQPAPCTFVRYTTRRKQGGSQLAHDAKGSAAQSAGAQMRRENERLWRADVAQYLTGPGSAWSAVKPEVGLFLVALGDYRRMAHSLLGQFDNILPVPMSTSRPKVDELQRIAEELAVVTVSRTPPEPAAPEPAGPLPVAVAAAPVTAEPPASAETPADPLLAKVQQIVRRLRRAVARKSTGVLRSELLALGIEVVKAPAEDAELAAEEFVARVTPTRTPEQAALLDRLLAHCEPDGGNLLHEAASSSSHQVCSILLEVGFDPRMTRASGASARVTPFEDAASEEVRAAFCRAWARHPGRWDWARAGRVSPGPLDRQSYLQAVAPPPPGPGSATGAAAAAAAAATTTTTTTTPAADVDLIQSALLLRPAGGSAPGPRSSELGRLSSKDIRDRIRRTNLRAQGSPLVGQRLDEPVGYAPARPTAAKPPGSRPTPRPGPAPSPTPSPAPAPAPAPARPSANSPEERERRRLAVEARLRSMAENNSP